MALSAPIDRRFPKPEIESMNIDELKTFIEEKLKAKTYTRSQWDVAGVRVIHLEHPRLFRAPSQRILNRGIVRR
jgi:hypothetical protein